MRRFNLTRLFRHRRGEHTGVIVGISNWKRENKRYLWGPGTFGKDLA